ncbi:NEDD4 family-interacting protein 1, partial [Biomphalaria pfeifferi]
MLPFMSEDILNIFSLLQRFVSEDVLGACRSSLSVATLDLSSTKLLALEKVDIGFKAKKSLSGISKASPTSPKDILVFRMHCRDFLKTTASKVLEKSPIKYKLVRSMKWLQPKAIVIDHVSCLKQLENTLNCLSTLGRIDENKCDIIKAQYRQCYNQIISNSSVDFQSFDSSFQRLDVFFKEHLGRQSEFKDLWTVVRLLLMLSHGQAQLQSEEQNVPAEPVSMAMVIAPPGYAESAVLEHQGDIPAYGPAKLPNYEDATTLPSYEEAERSKLEQDISNGPSALTDCEGGMLTGADNISEIAIGSDGMFICTFLISFLFNWLGFLLSLCLSNTVAGRCGALSGLGLSIVKWVVIVK